MLLAVIGLQTLSLFLAYKLSRMFFSFLFLANVIIFLNQIGTLYQSVHVYSNNLKPSFFLLLTSFSLNLGGYFALKKFKRKKKSDCLIEFDDRKQEKNEIKYDNDYPKQSYVFAGLSLFVICLFITIFNFIQNGIPILTDNIEIIRVEYSKLPLYRINQIFMPFLSIVILSFALSTQKKKYFFISVYVIIINILVLFSLGFKGFVLWYVFLVLMMANIYKKGKLRIISILPMMTIVFISLSLSTKLIYKYNDIPTVIKKVVQRLTTANAYGYCILVNEFIPSGTNTHSNQPLNAYLWKWKLGANSKRAALNMQFTITLTGSLLYYYGHGGIIIFSILFGYIFHYLNLLCFRYLDEPLIISFLVYFCYMFLGVINRGLGRHFYIYMLSSLLIIFFLTLIIFILIEKKPTIRF